jgi:hypothetical protein
MLFNDIEWSFELDPRGRELAPHARKARIRADALLAQRLVRPEFMSIEVVGNSLKPKQAIFLIRS